MKIYRAIKTNFFTQGFYDNHLSVYKEMGMKWHGGYDWFSKMGEPIYFDVDYPGIVLNTEIDSKGGLGLNILTESAAIILKHRYWHLKSFNVKAGDKIYTGQLIGFADTTGYALGSHLHRDMKEMLKDSVTGAYKVKNLDNGSFGTIPVEQYFQNIFVLDYIATLRTQVSVLEKMIGLLKTLLQLRIRIEKKQ